MKLWVDDVRKPPDDTWTWARTNDAAREYLRHGDVVEASLDHDMGGHERDPDDPRAIYFKGDAKDNGVELVKWMTRTFRVPPVVTIHSWNPVGAFRMAALLESVAGIRATVTPYDSQPDVERRCRWCGGELHPRQQRYCSQLCRTEYNAGL